MSNKLWQGRFKGQIDERTNDFNSSIRFDCRMIFDDIKGSMAHAKMLKATHILSDETADSILAGLEGIKADLENDKLEVDFTAEDVHTFIEQTLTSRIGSAGGALHTARSRNDQVALDVRLYLRNEAESLKEQLIELIETLIKLAKKHTETIMPSYTHLQRAQPVTFSHYINAYISMFFRDIERLVDAKNRMNFCPLGAGALAGTTHSIDRFMTAKELGFLAPTENSLDSVSDRDFCIELASCLSILMMHLSRFSEEIILFCSQEFSFIELSDAFSTGSSIMPQKKNPDIAELIRGKTGRVYGDLTTLLTMMKNLPLAYNKDMQEDKEAIFDAFDTVKLALTAFIPMIDTMSVNKENMLKSASKGFLNATDLADFLAKKGMPFREAYKIVGSLVAFAIDNNTSLEEIKLDKLQEYSDLFSDDVYDAISLETCVMKRNSYGGPAKEQVQKFIENAENKLIDIKNL